ncbi:prepilin peptidase [Streptomyces sp. NPDC048350]|uniref:prepilin peptidase n=1 Tax=Streptomyces sp. NPDC048350 TaxID=3365538 RepID=UPI0037157221
MFVTLIAVAALWGVATGLLVPRAAYRLSVEPEEPWRDRCEAGHELAGPARGWLGAPACAACATAPRPVADPAVDSAPATNPVPTTDSVPTVDSVPATDLAPAVDSVPAAAPVPATAPVPAPNPVPVGRRHLVAPVLTALACVALAAVTGPRPELAVWLLLAPFAVLLATVDARVHRLPDPLTLPLAAATPLLLLGAELLPYDAGSWLHALLGGLALSAGYFVLFLIRPSGMGLGDVKLALCLGAALGWYGWGILFVGTFAAFLAGSLYGLALVLARRGSRKSAIPFGPFMIGGALVGLVLGALSASP